LIVERRGSGGANAIKSWRLGAAVLENRGVISAIVIPSYRAEKTLASTVARIPATFWENGITIIVNDASPDDTGAVADKLTQKYPQLRVVHHQQNQGYGGAQKTGLLRGLNEDAGAFAVVHADGQYAPELVLTMLEPIQRGEAEIVQGSRMIAGGAREGGMPLMRYIPNRALTTLENVVFGTRMAEFHSGYMAYSRNLLERTPFEKLRNNYNFDAEMIVMAHLLGYRCKEIPIPTRYDEEVSSLRPVPYGINVLKMVGRFIKGHYRQLLDEHQPGQRQRVAGGAT
jgi:glycosyltransferase involved in cell wall biosynthesis